MSVFTNSLRSTDAVPVVAMYRKIREPMVRENVNVFEMRPDAASRPLYADSSVSDARLSLHAKAVIFDERDVFVGTFNIDPRSEHLNTEVGLLVHSTELAKKLAEDFQQDLKPQNSYLVTLSENKKKLKWVCEQDNKVKTFASDPEAGFWLHLQAGFFALLPISSQL